MKNQTWIVKLWANVWIAPADFTCPVLPQNATATDYESAINAIETAVANSTNPLSLQKRSYMMVEMADLTEEYADIKSVKLACGDEYCKTAKPKSSIKLDVKNMNDPYMKQILTGVKSVEDATNATFYRNQKFICKTLPQMVAKIQSCPDANGNVNTHYFLPTTLSGSMITSYQDYCEKDFKGAELVLEVSSWWCMIEKIKTFDKLQNDDLAST